MNSIACVPQNELSLLFSNVSGKIGLSPGGHDGRTYDLRRTTDATDMRHDDRRKSKSRDVVRARRMS